MSKKIEVRIFSQTFEISSDRLSEEDLKDLAQFVDEQMKETFQSTNLSSALKVAVLTALNLAEEIRSKKSSPREETEEWTKKVLSISDKLNNLSDSLEGLFHE